MRIYGVCTLVAHAATCRRPASVGPHCQTRCSHHPLRQFSLEGLNLQLDDGGGSMQSHILYCLKRLQSDHKCHHLHSQTIYAIILIVRPQMPSPLQLNHKCYHLYIQTTNAIVFIVSSQMPSSLYSDHKCHQPYTPQNEAVTHNYVFHWIVTRGDSPTTHTVILTDSMSLLQNVECKPRLTCVNV